MTKDQALKLALEYIETNAHERRHVRWAIKEALAKPEQRPWLGLTDEEIIDAWMWSDCDLHNIEGAHFQALYQYIEAKLKAKNT
jgi:hypothetical protein